MRCAPPLDRCYFLLSLSLPSCPPPALWSTLAYAFVQYKFIFERMEARSSTEALALPLSPQLNSPRHLLTSRGLPPTLGPQGLMPHKELSMGQGAGSSPPHSGSGAC